MNEELKITIITATFNSVKTLEQTILSVLKQSYSNIEFIVIDGASTDGTVDLIKKYENDITYWISEKDEGIYDALNKGIKKAKGDYICFLGSDDALCNENSIRDIIPYFDEDIDVLCANVWQVGELDHLQKMSDAKTELGKVRQGKYMPHHQGMFTKAKMIKKYYFDAKYKIAADYDLFWKILSESNSRIKCINVPVVYFSSGQGASANVGESIPEYSEIMKKNFINEKIVERYQKQYNIIFIIRRKIMILLKLVLAKLGMLKYIKLKQGWSVHDCSLEKCRWCRKERRNF